MNSELLLGIDIGSSSVKASLVSVATGKTVASAQSPAEEMGMIATRPGWAEQAPSLWWEHVSASIGKALASLGGSSASVKAIGISYQMHGLVAVDRNGEPVRPSIIWCDSRAVETGDELTGRLGLDFALKHYLNAPGNFTASKLTWVKKNEPRVFEQIDKIMLPGDYIAYRLTGETCTTDTGLSEGILWDYQSCGIATDLLQKMEVPTSILPRAVPVFSVQGRLLPAVAKALNLPAGIPVSYRAGDQPNNAFSLRVLHPGETAATAGTSGVIYSVTDKPAYDPRSRVNTFVHVNNEQTKGAKRNGVLLCVNGTGILNSWLRRLNGGTPPPYDQMNRLAASVPVGAGGISFIPFGNGAERMLGNREPGASIHGLQFNQHGQGHLYRAAQEGIVFALAYGFEILGSMGLATRVIRAGKANMFLSPVFREAFVNTIGATLEFYDTDGARGAALGAGVGAGIYASPEEAFGGLELLSAQSPNPQHQDAYQQAYRQWKTVLQRTAGDL